MKSKNIPGNFTINREHILKIAARFLYINPKEINLDPNDRPEILRSGRAILNQGSDALHNTECEEYEYFCIYDRSQLVEENNRLN